MISLKEDEIQDKEMKYELKEAELENWDNLTKQQYYKNGSGCCSLTKMWSFFQNWKGLF